MKTSTVQVPYAASAVSSLGRQVRPVGILGMGAAVPLRVLTNAHLERMVDTSDEWIRTRTGILERRIADEGTASSDLALEAAQKALARAELTPECLDLILVATITPDMIFPCTASLLQHRLGAPRAGAADLVVGCTGFVYALALGAQGVATGLHENVLVVGADVLSRITNWKDRNTCVLFGDGAGAAVLGPAEEDRGLLSCVLGNDGSGADCLTLPAGGSRRPASHQTVERGEHFIQMEGNEVFRFAVRIMEEAAREAVDRAGLSLEDIDLVVPHQANTRIIDAAAKRLGLPEERFVSNVDRYGNTSCASIPLALAEAEQQGRLSRGNLVLCVSFGAGLSWAAMVMRW